MSTRLERLGAEAIAADRLHAAQRSRSRRRRPGASRRRSLGRARPANGGAQAIMRFTPATLAVSTLMWAEATSGYLPPGHVAADRVHRDVAVAEHHARQRLDLDVLQRESRWICAKWRICACAKRMSSIVCGAGWLDAGVDLGLASAGRTAGDHLSNFSAVLAHRGIAALSMSARMPSTVARTWARRRPYLGSARREVLEGGNDASSVTPQLFSGTLRLPFANDTHDHLQDSLCP
jgi:hypothetical protein